MVEEDLILDGTDLNGACDCAIHIYDSARPLAPNANFAPPDAPLAAYPLPKAAPWFSRVVLSQPTAYGFDNSLLLQAQAKRGDSARAVIVVPPDITDLELERLHIAGARGVRFMLQGGGALDPTALPGLAARIGPLGWHVKLQAAAAAVPALVRGLPILSVVDVHPATFPQGRDARFLDLFRTAEIVVALSAPFPGQLQDCGPFDALVEELIGIAPDRVIWAGNWPHVKALPPADPLDPVRWLADRAGETMVLRRILVETPAHLFGFR